MVGKAPHHRLAGEQGPALLNGAGGLVDAPVHRVAAAVVGAVPLHVQVVLADVEEGGAAGLLDLRQDQLVQGGDPPGELLGGEPPVALPAQGGVVDAVHAGLFVAPGQGAHALGDALQAV